MSFFIRMFNNNRHGQTKTKKSTLQEEKPPSKRLEDNVQYIKDKLFNTNDLSERKVTFADSEGALLYLGSMCDGEKIYRYIVEPIQTSHEEQLDKVILSPELEKVADLNYAMSKLLNGWCVVLLDGEKEVYLAETRALDKRAIEEPDNERVVRGEHDGFIESLLTNIQLLRKRIQNPNLVVRYYTIGKETRTKIAIIYMQGLANPELIEKVDQRLRAISADTILSPGFVEEYIEDQPFSPFPQTLTTERPDRVLANLMEGRVAIFSEGDPTAMIIPTTLFAFYQTPDDYHSRWIVGSFVRLIRFAAFFIAWTLPAAYITIVSFHPEVLPINLAYNIQGTLQNIPFPPVVEALLMELTIELIREAGIRLPSPVGQTIGIVGGLVIGDAVVKAGFISYTVIIVVALTSISSFVVPSNDMSTSIRILRFPLMIMSALFGIMGILFGFMVIFIHLCKLESFGTPYFSPIMPLRIRDWKDTLIRFPIWKLNERPQDPHPQKLNQERTSREWEQNEKSR